MSHPDCAVNCKSPEPTQAAEVKVVGEMLNHRIQQAREKVEYLCNLKARAEALNMLDYPASFVEQLGNNMY